MLFYSNLVTVPPIRLGKIETYYIIFYRIQRAIALFHTFTAQERSETSRVKTFGYLDKKKSITSFKKYVLAPQKIIFFVGTIKWCAKEISLICLESELKTSVWSTKKNEKKLKFETSI